jgi:pantoate--beta-alanine ligase
MSSRNVYLSPEQRKQALVISRALRAAFDLSASGETSSSELRNTMSSVMGEEPSARIDYIAVADPDTLEDIRDIAGGGLLAIAASFGSTRLIDNMLIGESRPLALGQT